MEPERVRKRSHMSAFSNLLSISHVCLLLKKKKLFYFWLCWVFVAVQNFFSLVPASRGYSLVLVHRFLLLWSTGSRTCGLGGCCSWALEHSLSSSGTRAELLRGMWGLPRPEVEPMSSALADGFFTTKLPCMPS